MKSFVNYDLSNCKLDTDNETMIPTFCKNMMKKGNVNCQKHYQSLKESKRVTECPYGFYSKKEGEKIITCLTPLKCKGLDKLMRYKDKKENFIIMEKEKLDLLLAEYSEQRKENEKLHGCIHDLKNIGTYFNSMAFKIKKTYPDLSENDNDIKAMLELYNMMNYRLQLVGKLPEPGYKKEIIKLHSILLKLIIILGFKARNREIKFNLSETELNIIGSDHLYLALFTLLDNAVKYSPPRGEINIYFTEKVTEVSVVIENRGPIVEENELSLITSLGYRGINSNTTGNGVGLSVFKEICDKCAYQYNFKSKRINPNQGLFIATITLKISEQNEER